MIYLIRHGEPAFPDGKRLCLGRMDLPLSAAGQEQAEQVGLYLQRKLPNARIVSSPLLRCRQTANPAGLPYEICPELAEVDMGCWTGLPFDEIRLRWPELYERRGRDPLYISPPGGETMSQCGTRVTACLRRLLEEKPEEDLVIVAHSGVNRMLQAALTGMKLPGAMNYGTITGVTWQQERFRVAFSGQAPEVLIQQEINYGEE